MNSNQTATSGGTNNKLRHSKFSKILVLISGVVLFSFLFISFFISKQVRFKEQIVVGAPFETLYYKVIDLKEWRSWTVWDDAYYQHQTDRRIEYVTDVSGKVIKSLEYKVATADQANIQNSKSHPTLVIELVKVVTNENAYPSKKNGVEISFLYSLWSSDQSTESIDATPIGATASSVYDVPPTLTAWARILITPLDNNKYEISWEYDGDYSPVMGGNPLQKYFLIFTEFSLKRAYRQSLKILKEQLE